MKLQPLALSAAIILLASATSYAGNGYFTALLRNCGYGYGDGYHARRNCLPDDTSCSACSPAQQPMIPQPMMQQPMSQEVMQQQPVLQQPMMAPGYSTWAPPQFPQSSDPNAFPVAYPVSYPVSYPNAYPNTYPDTYPNTYPDTYPVTYPVTQTQQPWYQSNALVPDQPMTPAAAIPEAHW